MPKLYHFSLDPIRRRMRLALAEYGLGFELIEQKPWEPDPASTASIPRAPCRFS